MKRFWQGTVLLAALLLTGCQPKNVSSQQKPRETAAQKAAKKRKLAAQKARIYIYKGKISASDQKQLDKLDVAAFGDSVMKGCAPAYQQLFPKISIDAQESRQAAALPGLAAGLPASKKLVLIGLGTNGYLEKSTITQTVKELKGREIYWINNNVDRDWEESNNELIAEAAKKYKNVHMIDWKNASMDHDEWFADGIHPTEDGIKAMTTLVARTILVDEGLKKF